MTPKFSDMHIDICRAILANSRSRIALAGLQVLLSSSTGRKFGPPLEVKRAPSAGHKISGYGSTFGTVDLYKEIVVAGAFANSLARYRAAGTAPLMLWQHQSREPIGVWDKVVEDDRGLHVEGRLLPEVQRGKEAIALVDAGAIAGLSIGYTVIKKQEDQKTGIVLLLELDLLEISIVSFPANAEARVTSGKEYTDREMRHVLADLRRRVSNFHIARN